MKAALDVEALLEALRTVVPASARPAPLHEPLFGGREWEYVKECLDTGWVSYAGAFVERFERELETVTGVEHAIATVNGTTALHVGLHALGVMPGDEVLMPALTFVASANAVRHAGAIPHFVDVCPDRLAVDPEALAEHLSKVARRRGDELVNRRTGARLRALIVVHVFGHPADLEGLREVAGSYDLPIVEDAAEALGSTRDGRHVGGEGIFSILSFNGNKVATTGGGGAILTRDRGLAERTRHLTTTAKVPHPWRYWHDEVGFNYRMPNLNAAVGCAQLDQLSGFVERKRALARRYEEALEPVAGVRFVTEPDGCRSNYWLNSALLPEGGQALEEVLRRTHEEGLLTRPVWVPLHLLPPFENAPRAPLTVTEALQHRIVSLPSSASLYDSDDSA